MGRVKSFLVGKPLPSEAEKEERLTKIKALAVFSSDAISSSAYATEEILLVMIAAGSAGLRTALPIAIAIALLLGIVSFSYRQTVHAYPQGGGAYNVSRENLGTQAGLVAGAALLIDYVLTVAVSVSAGTAAITSAFSQLHPYRVELSFFFVVIITLINLRGVRESASIFAVPTYLFIASLTAIIALGVARIFLGLSPVEYHASPLPATPNDISLILILHAFAAGSVAMTGTEAISNGVPAFKIPESKNAATTLTVMSSILAFFFIGLTFLADRFNIIPSETETVISQVARAVFGDGFAYGVFQIATMLILVLAANTSYSGFPRLAFVLARDGFMPHQFSFRGDRLAFSNGIIYLGVLAAILIVLFGASTHALIPLYAVGVFISFTFSQAGMVRHWIKSKAPGWRKSIVVNALGALLTLLVLVIVGSVKFFLGAWMVLILVPVLVIGFNLIHNHYRRTAEQLAVGTLNGALTKPVKQIVLVPIHDLNKASLRALAFARSISKDPIALHVMYDPEESQEFQTKWNEWASGTALVVLQSPFRSFIAPFLAYVDAMQKRDPDAYITIILAESIPAKLWQQLLHNQTALRLKAALLFRPNTVVIDVPYHLTQ
ncbi:MAG: APC family permease [Chloroflexi bacterium]|nr:APC family permease [Chloroflexota bacterium]MBI3740802.1 APC family permease [Chloroflexota bacterium]